MADNTIINLGSGGDTIATDDIAGVKYQRVKLSIGADGAATDAALTAPLPVRLSDGTSAISTLPVSLASVPSHPVTNAGTFATQATLAAETTKVIGTVNIAAAQTVATVTTVGTLTGTTTLTPGTGAANLGKAEDAVHASGDVGVMSLAVRRDANTTFVSADGDYSPLAVDSAGSLKVAIISGGGSGGTSAVDDAAFTVASGSGTPMMGVVTADSVDSGDVGVVGMTATRSIKTVVTNSTGTVIDPQVDDAAFTAATSLVSVIGGIVTSDSVDSGDAGALGMSVDRTLYVSPRAQTTGGSTPYKNLDVDETEDDVKTSAGQVFWIHAINLAATKRYLKFYNLAAASVTVGTTTPVLTFPLPTQADTNGAGFTISFPNGVAFSTAICIAATTGFADNDTGAPGANEVIVNLGYI